jgi:CHASE2 domain-containing sensor protein
VKKKSSHSGNYVPKTIQRRRAWRIVRDLIVGLVLTFALLHGESVAEKNPRVAAATEYFYDLLQFRLKPIKAKEDSIAVVDISDVPLKPNPKDLAGEHYTSRQVLEEVVDGILKQTPAAIGLDVDLSMGKDGTFFSDEDKEFLDFCLARRRQVNGKFFVGVTSWLERGPDKWLGEEKYRGLATYIGHPNPEGFRVNPQMDEWIDIPHVAGDGNTYYWRLRTLAAALAGTPPGPPRLLEWAIDRSDEKVKKDEGGVIYRQFFVDFSPIDDFKQNAIATTSPIALSEYKQLKGKIVLVGRGAAGTTPAPNDTFLVRGLRGDEYPGILLHACATYTLLGKKQLLRLQPRARWAIDILFSLSVFGTIAGISFFYNSRVREDVAVHRLRRFLTWGAVILVFVFGELMINVTRVLWPEYFLVMIALFVHSSIEDSEHWFKETAISARTAWRKFVLDHGQDREDRS